MDNNSSPRLYIQKVKDELFFVSMHFFSNLFDEEPK